MLALLYQDSKKVVSRSIPEIKAIQLLFRNLKLSDMTKLKSFMLLLSISVIISGYSKKHQKTASNLGQKIHGSGNTKANQ